MNSPAPRKIVVLDGYNVMHRAPGFKEVSTDALGNAREALIRRCSEWLTSRLDVAEAFVVFDGNSDVAAMRRESVGRVRVVYTETGESADDWILSFVRGAGKAEDYIVISDDNNVSRNSRALGAHTLRVSEFFTALQKKSSARQQRSDNTKAPLSPSAERDINEAVKKAWGIE